MLSETNFFARIPPKASSEVVFFFFTAGHLSYGQMESVREVLRGVGTWDLVRLNCGEQLKGDYRSCQYVALNRQDTDTLEFSTGAALSAGALWSLLGLSPQVSPRHRAGSGLRETGQQGAVGLYGFISSVILSWLLNI